MTPLDYGHDRAKRKALDQPATFADHDTCGWGRTPRAVASAVQTGSA